MKKRSMHAKLFGIFCVMLAAEGLGAPAGRVPLIGVVLWLALVIAMMVVGMFLLFRRVRCPKCKASLLKGTDHLVACPSCQTSLDAPYPG